MNSLSWFLYIADVVGGVALLLMVLSVSWLLIGTYFIIFYRKSATLDQPELWEMSEKIYPSSYEGEKREAFVERMTEKAARVQEQGPPNKLLSVVLPALLLLFSFFLPSKEAIYLIAGSEAGEAVVTSDEGREIINDIHMVIKHQLSELKG